MKLLAAAVTATCALVLVGCQLFQIGAVVDRDVELTRRHLQVTGTVTCSEPEPITMFLTITQDGRTTGYDERTLACDGDSPFAEFYYHNGEHTGEARLRARFITNPGDFANEDEVIVERRVILYAG